jgi:hypothetical protein
MAVCGSGLARMRSLTAAALAALALLAGCAVLPGAYGPGPLRAGDSAAAVRDRMGVPTEQLSRPDGTQRWVYARGPMGRHTWMVDVGADGRVTQLFQALEPARFATVAAGSPEAEVRSRLGPPAEQRRLAVTLDRAGRVLDAGYIPDPLCDVDID